MNPILQARAQLASRRAFLRGSTLGLGAIAMGQLAGNSATPPTGLENPLAPKAPPLPATAKRVIYLHMAGSPP